MRTFFGAAIAAILSLSLCHPALAFDREREEFLSRAHWQCERGDHEACRVYHLYRQCQGGNVRACEEIERERYHDHWHERERWREHERHHDRERWDR